MLHLVQSNKMENLALQLVDWLRESFAQKASVMEADSVLVQSPGMAQWLKLFVAQQLGITANIDFPLPSSYIWQLYQQHIEDLPAQSAFTKPNMTWKLMHLLPGLLERDEFIEVARYLNDDNPLKRYQLCVKIADVFDQYLVYRPDWILTWEQGENQLTDADVSLQPWQPILWRELVSFSERLGESGYHRANLHNQLLGQLNNSTDQAQPILVFGMSALPQQQLEVLNALANNRDVVIFWLNPSFHYWGDVVDEKIRDKKRLANQDKDNDYLEVGNPLLSSWGKLGKDYQDLLIELDPVTQDVFDEPPASSLLEYLQQEILQLRFRGADEELSAEELLSNGTQYPKISIASSDQSLQVHVCHSMVRELEVLRDNLLKEFERRPDLNPGDIVVMMPDVATYAPLIDGVFGAADKAQFIPYAISDRSNAEESGILPSFLTLMSLHQSRLGLTEILSVFCIPAVLKQFDVSESEAELVKHWVAESGIRWGWDKEDKERWNLPEEAQNTWLFGFSRLLSGYAINNENLLETGEGIIAPYADIEGHEAAAFGKFYQFSKIVHQALLYCQQRGKIADKIAGALALVNQFFAESDETLQDIIGIRQAIESLSVHQIQFTGEVTQDIFVAELQQVLGEKGVGQRFLAGYVNFCTLMPMRSIPFSHVCILGLNDGDYPRQTVPVGFDLMRNSQARKGDRSRRFDDRYLFLEAILSARSNLHLSYLGFSQKDNSARSPSVLISELLEYCGFTFCIEEQQSLDPAITKRNLLDQLVIQYPLQPFSEAHYLKSSNKIASVERKWFEVANQMRQPPVDVEFSSVSLEKLNESDDAGVVELDDFINFFMNPAKAFFKIRWNTSLYLRQQELIDSEPFELDPLSRFKLTEISLQQSDLDFSSQFQAEGVLPQGNAGILHLQRFSEQNSLFADKLNALRNGRQCTHVDTIFVMPEHKLVGNIDCIYEDELILWRPGKIRARDKIELWIKLMMLCAQQPQTLCRHAHFLGTDGCFSLHGVEQHIAENELNQFFEFWLKGQTSVLFCFPESAWAWLKTRDKNKTLAQFEGNAFVNGEGQEPHIARVCPDLSVHFEKFVLQSEELYSNLFNLAEGKI